MISGTITDLSPACCRARRRRRSEFGAPCGAVLHRPQLCARARDARAHRRIVAHRRHDAGVRLSRTPACRTSSGFTTKARSSWPSLGRICQRWPREHRRGCCGTTPAHIRAIADAVKDSRRARSGSSAALRLSGLEPFTLTRNPVRQCRRAYQCHGLCQFRKLITAR